MILRFLLICLAVSTLWAEGPPFVVGHLHCQLGNNLFQVATTCALAWDNGAEPLFPDLIARQEDGMPINYRHVFFRCNAQKPSIPYATWCLPGKFNFAYYPIPYKPHMAIFGTFQCEKYFLHYREQLLELFAPHPHDLQYIKNKYAYILNHPYTVGVQIRWFGGKKDEPWHDSLVQYGYDFFQKAISYFPQEALFIVTSNNIEFAKANFPQVKNCIFLESEPYYIDFYLLTMCKHNIISNSTFGWWGAWLNKNVGKIVVHPMLWVHPLVYKNSAAVEVWPKEWIGVQAEWVHPKKYALLGQDQN